MAHVDINLGKGPDGIQVSQELILTKIRSILKMGDSKLQKRQKLV